VSRLLIVAQEAEALAGLCSGLIRNGFACSVISHGSGLAEKIAARRPDLVMLETDSSSANAEIRELTQGVRQEGSLLIIALVARDKLDSIDEHIDVDDFVVNPYDTKELLLRIKRFLDRTSNLDSGERIKCGGLVIDLAKCEVTVEGRLVELTFKEYELLKFLASNRGRVYTREALLNKIWGYDYYGGDRTVDVHIRRLRSKIEDSKHTFVETVRNIGNRFTGLQPHQMHRPAYPFVVSKMSLALKIDHHLAGPVEWRHQVLSVNQLHKIELLLGDSFWLVVPPGAADSQQLALAFD